MTLMEHVYQALRRDLLRGAFAAGSPLRLADLGARYGAGFSPLREALNRLAAERLVTAESLRGFRVAPVSSPEFEDIHATRLMIETQALRLSITRGGDPWEQELVAALHALGLQAARGREPDAVWELEARHHAFHRALLSACGSDWLLEFFERLHAASERYRIPVLMADGGAPARDIHAEHAALAEAALARSTETALALLAEHYHRTAEAIRAAPLPLPTPQPRRRAR